MRVLLLAGLLLVGATSAASAAMPEGLQGFVGNWACVLKSGSATYASSASNSVWGSWIKEEITFPAQNGAPASVGTGYLGYDAQLHRWIYAEIDSVGEYFITKSQSPRLRDSSWTSAFPTTGDTTTIRVNSR